jgi:hypothetical protein
LVDINDFITAKTEEEKNNKVLVDRRDLDYHNEEDEDEDGEYDEGNKKD